MSKIMFAFMFSVSPFTYADVGCNDWIPNLAEIISSASKEIKLQSVEDIRMLNG